MIPIRRSFTLVVAALAIAEPLAAQGSALETTLERAAAYVADFHRQLSSIVAEERYVQDSKPGRLTGSSDDRGGVRRHRELTSDLLLVKPHGADAWLQFRDVFEVDGTPIRERNERLVKMFLEPASSVNAQIARILDESARFNVGEIQRNVNTPIVPLLFLEAANQPRFTFKQTAERQPKHAGVVGAPADGAFRVSTEVHVIAYEEKARDTVIRTAAGKDLPAHGRFWIEPATGRVLMSELIVEDTLFRATIDVSYQSEPLLGLLVPIEMRERYELKRRNSVVEGHASYGRFRQFQVKVDEKIAPIK